MFCGLTVRLRCHLLFRSFTIGMMLPALSALLLLGCVSADGIAPQAQLQSPGKLAQPRPANGSAPLSQEWWQIYHDPQLNQLIEDAWQHSPTLKQAAARIRQAQATAGNTYSQGKLQADGNMATGVHRWPGDSHYGGGLFERTTWDNTAALGLRYRLDLFGRQQARDEQAEANVALSQADAQAAHLVLTENIVRSYIQLALNYQQREVQQARLQQQLEIVKLTQQKLTYGLGARYDLQQAQALLPVTRRQLRALDEAIDLNRNQLVTLAGLPLAHAATIKRPTMSLTDTFELPEAIPLALLAQRPDLVASRWQIVARARGVDLARADFYPNINLQAELGQMMTVGGPEQWLTAANRTYSAGPVLSLPILDGGRRRAQLGLAAAQYDEVVEQYNATLQQALREVSDQFISQRSAREQAQFADQAVAQAVVVYQTAEAAFQRGLQDYLHVLDAQTRLFDQQLARTTVHARLLQTQADLAVALGGGLRFTILPQDSQIKPLRVAIKAPATRSQ